MLLLLVSCLLTACWTRSVTVVRWIPAPTCLPPGEVPRQADGWFSACLAGAQTWRGLAALGCLTRAQVEQQAAYRIEDDLWKDAVVRQCGKPEP